MASPVVQRELGFPSARPLPPCRVLFVEDDVEAARLFGRRLRWAQGAAFDVAHARSLGAALKDLEVGDYDAVLLDLSLPDGEGMATVREVCALASELPVVILTGTDDDDLALRTIRAGAEDYLVKERQTGASIARAILLAIERQRRDVASGRTKS